MEHLRAWFRDSHGASGLLLYSRRPVCPKFHFLNKILAKSLDRVLLGLFHLSCCSWGCRDSSPATSGVPVRAVLSPQGWAVPISQVSPSVIPLPRSPKPAVGDHAMQTFSGVGSASVGGCYRESLIWSEVGLLQKCPDPPCGQPSPARAAQHTPSSPAAPVSAASVCDCTSPQGQGLAVLVTAECWWPVGTPGPGRSVLCSLGPLPPSAMRDFSSTSLSCSEASGSFLLQGKTRDPLLPPTPALGAGSGGVFTWPCPLQCRCCAPPPCLLGGLVLGPWAALDDLGWGRGEGCYAALSSVTLGWALTLSGHALRTLAEGGTGHPHMGTGVPVGGGAWVSTPPFSELLDDRPVYWPPPSAKR